MLQNLAIYFIYREIIVIFLLYRATQLKSHNVNMKTASLSTITKHNSKKLYNFAIYFIYIKIIIIFYNICDAIDVKQCEYENCNLLITIKDNSRMMQKVLYILYIYIQKLLYFIISQRN